MAIPSLAMIPSLGNQMMQTAQAPTPLDAIRERRNERDKIEMEKKYKEAMAEKTLWEIEAAKKEQEREEQFRQYMQSRFNQGPTGVTGAPAGGGLSSIPPNGGGGSGGMPFTDAGLYAFQGGFYDKAAPMLNMGATYQSNIGQVNSRNQKQMEERAMAAWLGYETGQDPKKIAAKTGFNSKEEAQAAVPKMALDRLFKVRDDAKAAAAKGKDTGPKNIGQWADIETKGINYFNASLIENYPIPLTEDGNPDPDKFIDQSRAMAQKAFIARAQMMMDNGVGMKAGETPISAAWREVNQMFDLMEYSPWLGTNKTVLVPKTFSERILEQYPEATESEIAEAFMMEAGWKE